MKLILFLMIGLLSACASTQSKMTEVQRGMKNDEVKSLLGAPDDRTFRGSQELWAYETKAGEAPKVIVFEGGKVVELLNSDAALKSMHRMEKADISTHGSKNFRCFGNNEFGKFSEGGGCNLYGCWAKGGYCNQFGCSTTGSCTVRGCPQKVASLQCQD